MRYNKLMKTASVLLATVMTLGLFAFVAPAKDIKADGEYTFDNISEWPEDSSGHYATIDNVKWYAITSAEAGEYGFLKGKLPTNQEEAYPDCNHYILNSDITLSAPLDLSGSGNDVVLDLNGHNITSQCQGQILNLSDGAQYTIQSSSECCILNSGTTGGEHGGYFSVNGGSKLRISGVNIAGGRADSTNNDAKGGAVYVGASSTANFVNVNFTGCNAAGGEGGAVYVAGTGTATFSNVYFNLNGSASAYVFAGPAIYCATDGTVFLSDSVTSGTNYTTNPGDIWFNDESHIQISSTTNDFSIGCSDYTNAYFGVFTNSGGDISGIRCADSMYELTEEGSEGFPHIATVQSASEVSLVGVSAIVNTEDNGTYYPVAFKVTLNIPSSYQAAGYKYVVRYNYEYNGKPREEIRRSDSTASTFSSSGDTDLIIGMSPALLAYDITWEVINYSDNSVVATDTVSPMDCLEAYITKGDDNTKAIAKSLIIFGIYSEEYFYKTDTLKEKAIDKSLISDSDLTLANIPNQSPATSVTGFNDGHLSYYGCSMILNADGLTMRQYVLYDKGAMNDNISCSVNGDKDNTSVVYKINKDGKAFYIKDAKQIKMLEINTPITFSFSYSGQSKEVGAVEYSVMDYMISVMSQNSGNTKLNNYLKSLYALYTACSAAQ